MMKRKMIISGLIASILSVPVLVSAQSINSNANGEKVKSEQGYIRGNKAFGQSQGKGLGKEGKGLGKERNGEQGKGQGRRGRRGERLNSYIEEADGLLTEKNKNNLKSSIDKEAKLREDIFNINGGQRGKGSCKNLPNITDEAKKELETLRDETRALRENNQNTMQEFRNAVNNKDKEATNTASQKLTQQINTRISLLQKKVDLLNKYIK